MKAGRKGHLKTHLQIQGRREWSESYHTSNVSLMVGTSCALGLLLAYKLFEVQEHNTGNCMPWSIKHSQLHITDTYILRIKDFQLQIKENHTLKNSERLMLEEKVSKRKDDSKREESSESKIQMIQLEVILMTKRLLERKLRKP